MREEDGWEGVHGEAELLGELWGWDGRGEGRRQWMMGRYRRLIFEQTGRRRYRDEQTGRTIDKVIHQLLSCPNELALVRRVEIDLDAREPLLLQHP